MENKNVKKVDERVQKGTDNPYHVLLDAIGA